MKLKKRQSGIVERSGMSGKRSRDDGGELSLIVEVAAY